MQRYTWVIYRYVIVAMYVWFAVQQLVDPAAWIGYLPDWTGYLPVPGEMLVRMHGWTELMLAAFLCIGIYLRPVAAILAAHLLFIALDIGGAVGVRDAVIAVSIGLLALQPPDQYALETVLQE